MFAHSLKRVDKSNRTTTNKVISSNQCRNSDSNLAIPEKVSIEERNNVPTIDLTYEEREVIKSTGNESLE